MIVFLTLLYVAALALLVNRGVVRLNLFWKLSPILWMLILLVTLFVPMQWGAPTGDVNVYQYVIEIVPNVTGEVIEVPVEGLTPLKKDDVLFKIDPEPYQAVVDQLTATLEDAKHNVERLKNSVTLAKTHLAKTQQQIDIAKTQQVSATAALTGSEAALRQAKTERERATNQLADLQVQVAAASREFERMKELESTGAGSASDVDRLEVQYTSLTSQRDAAKLSITSADDGVAAAESKVSAAKASVRAADLLLKQLIETEIPRVQAELRDAELAANSMIGDEHTSVAVAKSQLHKALFDLQKTTVRAPSDGWAMGVTLRPGQRVSNLPLRAAMTFVDAKQTRLVVGVSQYAMRHVEPGQPVEVTLKLYPGQIFTGEVEKIAWLTPLGQMAPGGNVPGAPVESQLAMPFGVVLKMDNNENIDLTRLPGGAIGSGAVYTNQAQATHLIRRVMLRMKAWMNYVSPF
tara:strand:+ start:36253 stop:37641 length:1389 start_codon:yes stop_codon:yes gene_type:complete